MVFAWEPAQKDGVMEIWGDPTKGRLAAEWRLKFLGQFIR